MDTIPVLLDTDIGSDIDDAVALAYLLRQPRCELLGITTVTGEPQLRASLADAVCRAAGRDAVSIHVGIDLPIAVAQHQPHAQQAEMLTERWPHRRFLADNTAIPFLRETIRSRPGEVVLLAIGPLTNVAALFAADPEIPGLLRELMIMGGQFFAEPGQELGREWNILCDPQAAAAVFAAPLPRFTAVGLDVTLQCKLPADECRDRFAAAAGPLAPVASMADVWFRSEPAITFHDPLAAALIFDPTLCRTRPAHIEIEVEGTADPGQTRIVEKAPGNPVLMAADVDVARFFAHYFGVVGAAPAK